MQTVELTVRDYRYVTPTIIKFGFLNGSKKNSLQLKT